MAITDATWFEEDPALEAQGTWEQWSPEMGTEASRLRLARDLGLEGLGTFRLPRLDWLNDFEHAARGTAKVMRSTS